jgi:hypothetical protein
VVLQVIRGYIGDRSAKPVFNSATPFDILGTNYQRPFELATLRLFNMIGILPKCEDTQLPALPVCVSGLAEFGALRFCVVQFQVNT